MADPILFATCRVDTFDFGGALTSATGFFYENGPRLYLVTSQHVFRDDAGNHFPDRVEIGFHSSLTDLTQMIRYSMPLYRDQMSLWKAASDSDGLVDVVILEVDREMLPSEAIYQAFTPAHLPPPGMDIGIGAQFLTIGYPMGFHDSVHHLPVARQTGLASAYGIRFQGHGYFLVDARTHRGSSGSPVVMHRPAGGMDTPLQWWLLGIHSSRLDAGSRDPLLDEALGLNAIWYADILRTLT